MAESKETKKTAENSSKVEEKAAITPVTTDTAVVTSSSITAAQASEKKNCDPPKSVEKQAQTEARRPSGDRDIALAHVEQEKRLSFIKAWEESEKSKAINKEQKKLAELDAWESSKKATIEAKLKEIEQELIRKKAEYAEKMSNLVAQVHKTAEEKRAMVQAQRGEDVLRVEEKAAKYRATGYTPKKFLGCVSF